MNLDIRALQIDLARQKETIEFVKSYIDRAKKYDYTHVFFYLENVVRTEDTEFFNEEETYSLEEMKEIVDYAISLGLGVIPAFENLGHQEKLFFYPELEKFKETKDPDCVKRSFGVGDACPSNKEFLAFSDKYISDVCSIFPGEFVHVGLDEPWNFAVCKDCQERIKNGETKNELFLKHILHTYELCKKIGKRMIMWDDFFENADIVRDLPRDIIFSNWNYTYISQIPNGHWTNRNKKDWFALYDKLGFDYMFCTYANRTSSIYNVESFTEYALKHKPIGAIMTAWERADTFYEGAYPHIAYAGRLWAGKISTKEEIIDLYAEIIGSKKIAEVLYDFTSAGDGLNLTLTEKSVKDGMFKYANGKHLVYAVKEIEEEYGKLTGEGKDIVTDIYNVLYAGVLALKSNDIAKEVFANYELGKDNSYLIPEVQKIKDEYVKIKERADGLWAKNRPGIKSVKNKYGKKYENIFNGLDTVMANLAKNERCGVLSVEYLFTDMYATGQAIISVKHKGYDEEVVYHGNLKQAGSNYDLGGIFGYNFKTRNEEIEYVKFTGTGEGAMYPSYFRFVYNGQYFVPASVEVVEGQVMFAEKVLEDNTRFAMLGNDDGVAHFNYVELAHEKHTIKVTFKPIA